MHIIAWSVSGLDFRYYISKLGGDKYINSLTTIASPHRYLLIFNSAINKININKNTNKLLIIIKEDLIYLINTTKDK